MIIKDTYSVKELQESFSQTFPGLKIEFYKGQHSDFEGSHVKNQIHPDQLLKEIRTNHSDGEIVIRPDMTVLILEQLLKEKFGLNAQVFRKSGDVWLQTSVTDYLTLNLQNQKAIQSQNS